MEGGFPSSTPLDDELKKFAENAIYGDDCDYTDTVYGYVPREVFIREFELHGGIVEGCLPFWRNPLPYKDLGRGGRAAGRRKSLRTNDLQQKIKKTKKDSSYPLANDDNYSIMIE